MSARVLRMIAAEAIREVVGTAPSLAQQERGLAAAMAALMREHGGEEVRLYIPTLGAAARAARAREIRVLWNGRNQGELARQFGLSERRIRMIAVGR